MPCFFFFFALALYVARPSLKKKLGCDVPTASLAALVNLLEQLSII